ncbi:alpha-mannosidase 2 [Stomoxys calcitrans]|uniref:Alpha-mannosidase n=1 Tax=Stomoxys calcitrans TaxID=35570 RepID=A0A1I8PWA3_STOCA|nr:alpha-mannosidase 2 [Stomoxys calcitrans]
MIRIRRRFALLLCGISLVIFLTVYFMINYAAPSGQDKKPNFMALDNNQNEYNKQVLQKPDMSNENSPRTKNTGRHGGGAISHKLLDRNEEKKIVLANIANDPKLMEENVIAREETCEFDPQQVPQPDIQMLDMYDKMSFADIDGGVWKQGWNIKYDTLQYNDHHKLKVFVVPHSHNDPGWIKTFEDYYEHETKHILFNALRHLRENPDMKFIWAEISYFSRFYQDLGENNKEELKKLVKNGQLEFVSGGWVMPDEANSHWQNMLLQLTEGQHWLKKYLNVTPTSSWAIDPFGHTPSMPYILKKSGFENALIQRTHYSVKKELASKRNLEFYWRQLWDDTGETELFTHMMPFYSYDIPHSCGPDPKICCQFDFKRVSGFGLSCPWRVPPQTISDRNVAQRAELIVDQWKKKAELYRTNVVLFPLGDDFRYSQSTEWEVQRLNYEALFSHINGERKYFVEAKFGTLQEYFDAVHEEQRQKARTFPTLSGDFFTYADRADNYWSGYYTSRPFHKRMDRVLTHYVHSAEMLSAWHSWDASVKFDEMLEDARRQLSLFQHHDGITGTAKTHVVEDYANRMLGAVKNCKFVMQQSVYKLLTKKSIYNADTNFNYFYVDDSRWPGPDDSRTTIILGEELPQKHLVFHNALPQWREEVVDFHIASPFVSVTDSNNNPVEIQISPVWTWHKHTISNTITPQASTTKYRLIFKAKVPPLGLTTYIVKVETPESLNKNYVNFASNLILTTNPITTQLGDYPKEVKFGDHREVSLKVGSGPTVAFSLDGMMKSVQIKESESHTPVRVQFFKYGTRMSGDRSGAYLFLPNGPATLIVNAQTPVVLVTQGPLESSVSTGLSFGIHHTILRDGEAPEIRNNIDIADMDDTEVVMRLQSRIRSGETFYTDLNGLQVIKRQRFTKIPLQANYYPIPTAIYIEDESLRLSVVSAQPLGGSSLAPGEVEIMQDRRLTRDDERGLGHGVLDNRPVLHIFRIILERIEGCEKLADNHPAGALTLSAYRNSKYILNPLDKFIFAENDWLGVLSEFGSSHTALGDDMEVVVMRNLNSTSAVPAVARDRKQHAIQNTGLILHRTNLMQCSGLEAKNTGELNLRHFLQMANVSTAHKTTLTFLKRLSTHQFDEDVSLCPMDTLAFILQRPSSS